MSEENHAIDYMIRVLQRELDRHVEEYRREGMEASMDSFIHGLQLNFTRASLTVWIKELEKHRHCAPAEVSDKRQDRKVADERPQLSREQIDDMNSGD